MTDIKIKVSKDKELWEVWGKNDDNPDTLLKDYSGTIDRMSLLKSALAKG